MKRRTLRASKWDRLDDVNKLNTFTSITACGPGKYKGKVASAVSYCSFLNGGKRDVCLPCAGETIKPNSGDSNSCTEDCGGGSKVANAEHTACSKCLL